MQLTFVRYAACQFGRIDFVRWMDLIDWGPWSDMMYPTAPSSQPCSQCSLQTKLSAESTGSLHSVQKGVSQFYAFYVILSTYTKHPLDIFLSDDIFTYLCLLCDFGYGLICFNWCSDGDAQDIIKRPCKFPAPFADGGRFFSSAWHSGDANQPSQSHHGFGWSCSAFKVQYLSHSI